MERDTSFLIYWPFIIGLCLLCIIASYFRTHIACHMSFGCVDVLRPSQPNGVMSSAVFA